MFRQDDERPYDLITGRGQEASDYAPRYAGSAETSGEDRSPWYAGRSWGYCANAELAARMRRIDSQREQERAARRAAYLERRGAVAVAQ